MVTRPKSAIVRCSLEWQNLMINICNSSNGNQQIFARNECFVNLFQILIPPSMAPSRLNGLAAVVAVEVGTSALLILKLKWALCLASFQLFIECFEKPQRREPCLPKFNKA